MTAANVKPNRPAAAEPTRPGAMFQPVVDIGETPEAIFIWADLPGVAIEGIDIRLEDGVLTLHGHVAERKLEGSRQLAREYEIGDFYRTFQIPEPIDVDQISAEARDGVLTLRLPKSQAARPRKIAVRAG